MPRQGIAIQGIIFTLFFVGLLSANLTATLGWGSDKGSANPTITLDVANEPLKGVLGKISKTTGWKIKAPEKWMEKPVTQTLNKASMEEGLRSILKNAGIENLLLIYNEEIMAVTIFDTESVRGQSADRPSAQVTAQTPAVPVTNDPILSRPARDARSGPSRGIGRGTRRARSDDE